MSTTPQYDVVIIGAGLGGLLCGAILSKEGMKVCILEKNEQIGGSERRGQLRGFGLSRHLLQREKPAKPGGDANAHAVRLAAQQGADGEAVASAIEACGAPGKKIEKREYSSEDALLRGRSSAFQDACKTAAVGKRIGRNHQDEAGREGPERGVRELRNQRSGAPLQGLIQAEIP